MGADAFFVIIIIIIIIIIIYLFIYLFIYFKQNETTTGQDFFFRLTLDFVQEHLTESMLQHLCPEWNAHAKCTRFFVYLFWFGLVF